jgi:hypothetical protein
MSFVSNILVLWSFVTVRHGFMVICRIGLWSFVSIGLS